MPDRTFLGLLTTNDLLYTKMWSAIYFFILKTIFTHADSGSERGVFTSVYQCVCLFFSTTSENPMQLGSPNVTQKCFIDDSWKPIYLGVKSQRSRSWQHRRRRSLHSYERWLLLVWFMLFQRVHFVPCCRLSAWSRAEGRQHRHDHCRAPCTAHCDLAISNTQRTDRPHR